MASIAVSAFPSPVDLALPAEPLQRRWYAAYTRARHEKRVTEHLGQRAIEHFLPLCEAVHRWKNGRHTVQLPLFPGYLFVSIALKERLRVLQTPGVVRLIGFDGFPVPIPELEIAGLRNGIAQKLRMEPHAYLTVGRKVRVKEGPFEGLEGILIRRKNGPRVVLSISAIFRSFTVDVDLANIDVLG